MGPDHLYPPTTPASVIAAHSPLVAAPFRPAGLLRVANIGFSNGSDASTMFTNT